MRNSRFFSFSLMYLLLALPLQAAPWVNTDDLYLRSSIQLLADAGHLKTPVNTLPLMWRPLLQDLTTLDSSILDEHELLAYTRLLTAARFAQQSSSSALTVSASTDPLGQSAGANQYQQKGLFAISSEVVANNWSAGVVKQFRKDPFDSNLYSDNTSNWDGSYGAYAVGNWALIAGVLPQWWGPAQQQSFSFDNRTRPAKSLQLSRLNANELLGSTFDWFGPVHINVQVGEYAGTAVLRHARYGAARANFKPTAALEWGVSVFRIRPYTNELLTVPELFDRYSFEDMTTLGVDLQWRLGAGSVYAEISSQRSVAIANGWLVGAQWHFGHQKLLLNAFAELQYIPEKYQYWQGLQPDQPLQQLQRMVSVGLKAYSPEGRAAYIKTALTQSNMTETASLLTLQDYLIDPLSLQTGIQLPIWQGLLSFDYHLQYGERYGGQGNTLVHAAGFTWEWRW
ncbi:capsule assembly Wzi family protein [Rheinheimera sp. UJ51]|uniref:capsule assembly Wzi family protein n=1 Tax=Rheinheimera sp. UJ51 TaxID=2892446 RepID=UPI001E2BB41B|nr:capsule assembly Wzi family protein [Rheinheimera sp. UJ51]MCC5450265.1 capsule assembly Wzi family protein [Rheinheimera sp. UJ51]